MTGGPFVRGTLACHIRTPPAVGLTAVAFLASFLPARRATRVDPAIAPALEERARGGPGKAGTAGGAAIDISLRIRG